MFKPLSVRHISFLSRFFQKENPKVFLDISIDEQPQGRLIIELYQNKVPKTVENFRALCEGDRGKARSARVPLHYKGTPFHRIIPGYLCQGGDIIYKNGAGNLIIVFYREIYRLIGGESIYGLEFQDENFKVSHDKPGIVSMANRGPDKNSSQFFITFDACKRLDGYFVAFGQVVEGLDVLKKIEECGIKTDTGTPTKKVVIKDCGEFEESEPFDLDLGSGSKSESKSKSKSESGSESDD